MFTSLLTSFNFMIIFGLLALCLSYNRWQIYRAMWGSKLYLCTNDSCSGEALTHYHHQVNSLDEEIMVLLTPSFAGLMPHFSIMQGEKPLEFTQLYDPKCQSLYVRFKGKPEIGNAVIFTVTVGRMRRSFSISDAD